MSYANATRIEPQEPTLTGLAMDTEAFDDVNGVKFNNEPGRTVLYVKNETANLATFSFEAPGTYAGRALADQAATLAAGGEAFFGPFGGVFHQPGTRDVYVTCDEAVSIMLLHLPNPV
jgi:hypothetical protein